MKVYVLLGLFIFFQSIGFGQNRIVDSLKNQLREYVQEDSIRVGLLTSLATEEIYDHPTLAKDYSTQALAISKKINYSKGIALSYRLLGNSFWALGNQSAALSNFLSGKRIADSIYIPQIQADITGNLGMVYNDLSDYEKALFYYRQSLEKQVKLNNKFREGVMLVNIGNALYRSKRYDSALVYYQNALKMLMKLKGNQPLIDLVTIGIGEVKGETGNYDDALTYLNKAKNSTNKTQHHRGMVHVRIAIARVQIKMQQYAVAETELLECLAKATEVSLKTYVRDCYELLATVAEAQMHTAQALGFYKLFSAYKDSINSSAITSKVTSIQLEYEIQLKQLEIESLKLDSQLKAKEITVKNTWLVSSILGILLIAAFLFFFIKNYRYQKIINAQLSESNVEINKQRVELSVQNNEVLALNEEIQAQKDQLGAQNDALVERNREIRDLNLVVTEANDSLEKTVAERTKMLITQNKQLEEYAFINAHKLRAPVATILGIINLLRMNNSPDELSALVGYLEKSSLDLDNIVRAISHSLQQESGSFDSKSFQNEKKSKDPIDN